MMGWTMDFLAPMIPLARLAFTPKMFLAIPNLALARFDLSPMMGWTMDFLAPMIPLAIPATGLSSSFLIPPTAEIRLSFWAPSRWKLMVEVDCSTTVIITTMSTILLIG